MRRLVLLAILAGHGAAALAANCSSVNGGNWNNGAIWSCGATPGAADDVTINNGHNVSLNGANRSALSLTINNGGTLTTGSNSVTIVAGAGVLTIDGNVAGNGNNASRVIKNSTGNLSGGGTITNTNDLAIAGNTTVAAGTNLTFTGAECRMTISANVTVTNLGTLTFNTAACGTAASMSLANPTTFNNGDGATAGTVNVGQITGANAAGSVWNNNAGSTLIVTETVATPLLATGTLNASFNGNTVHYSPTAAQNQTIKAPSGGNYWHLTFSTGGTKTLVGVGNTLNIGGNLTVNTGVTVSATANDVILNVAGDMDLNGTATYLASNNAARALTVTGNLTIAGTFTGSTSPVNLAGNFTRTGTYTTGTGVFTFNGGALQTFTGATTITNVTLNNAAGVDLASNLTLGAAGALVLTNGTFNTGANIVITPRACNNAATVTRTNGWVNGNLRKAIPAGASTCTFEVGDATLYAPASLTFAAGTGAGNFQVSTTAGDHPNLNTSTIDPNFTINRYWTFTDVSVGITTYTATFTFNNPADLDTDTDPLAVIVQRFAAGAWNATTIGTRTATTTQITGLTVDGVFQIGEGRPTAGSGSFNAVEVGGAVLTNIRTKVGALAFNLDLVALNAARNAADTTFKGPVTVDILNSSNNAGGFDANGCKAGWTVIQSFAVTFAASENGRHTTSFTENNIYPDARVRVTYSIGGTDLLIGCSVDNFAIRPSTFDNVSASDLDWENPGTTRTLTNTATTGGVVHKAGRDFTVSARALNNASTVMTTYAGTPVAVTTIVAPAGGANGSLTFGSWSASSGTVTSTSASFSEAGVVTMRLEDQSYANVDASDGISTTTDRYVVGPDVDIGRFVPDHFTFTSPNTPALQTFGSSCASRSFTYVGQPFWYATLPSATIEARNVANGVTTNYRGALFKLAASGIGEGYSNNAVGPALITGASISPPQLTPGNGTGTYTAAASATDVYLAYTRSAATPIVPFNANISLTVTASDSSESAVSGNGTISAASSLVFNGIGFDSGNEFRYGRMRFLNATGPVSVDTPVTLRAEYYLSVAAGFVTNAADNCTPLAAGNFKLSSQTGSLTPGNMGDSHVSVPATLTSGIANGMKLLKASPAASGPGSVRICFDLDSGAGGDTACQATTPADRAYLQGPWSGAGNYDKDPGGQVNVGSFGAQPNNFIFFRENY